MISFNTIDLISHHFGQKLAIIPLRGNGDYGISDMTTELIDRY